MRKNLRLAAASLLLTVAASCVSPPHFRRVSPESAAWEREVKTYPRVSKTTYKSFEPTDPEDVEVFYDPLKGSYSWPFGKTGCVLHAPSNPTRLADLAVFRPSEPDHEGAVSELRQQAAQLGADMITKVRYTVIIGKTYIGGAELVGWLYTGRAARNKEKTR